MNFTDKDIIRFLTNVECLEGLFDTWGVFGQGFNNNLTLGGPTPIGARKANLSQEVESHLMEVALNEQVRSSSSVGPLDCSTCAFHPTSYNPAPVQ